MFILRCRQRVVQFPADAPAVFDNLIPSTDYVIVPKLQEGNRIILSGNLSASTGTIRLQYN